MKKSRKEILKINPTFSEFILDLQLIYKPEPYEEGERVDSASHNLEGNSKGITILTKETANDLNSKQNQEFENNRDKNPFSDSLYLNLIESRLIISSKQNTEDYLNDISQSLEQIRIELNESDLMILGVNNTPWLIQENDYKPVKKALDYLKRKIDSKFDGGFLFREENLIEFIPHLFWLTRCNASLPYFYMSFPKSKCIITLCKYGVLHFEFYDQDEKIKILKILSDLNFKELRNCSDPIEFDYFNGRQIKICS